jgi:hypothetical protein
MRCNSLKKIIIAGKVKSLNIKFEQLKSIIPNDIAFFIDSENGEDEYENKYCIPDEFNLMNVVYLSILDNTLHIKLY